MVFILAQNEYIHIKIYYVNLSKSIYELQVIFLLVRQ